MTDNIRLFQLTWKTDLGPLSALATEKALVGLFFQFHPLDLPEEAVFLIRRGPFELIGQPNKVLDKTETQLGEYLAGDRQAFDLELDPKGTDFQRAVWRALAAIPYGRVATYGQVAERIGRPKAARAVGQAVGANPMAVVIPCHRVVASNGLGGFGGGLSRKRLLLGLEGVTEADLDRARTAGSTP
ncbi:MAG: methylated-DNA--[protein]-cysteine S-methyltransferase [Deltaproteobacteria bacterium]|nr:methylated-DNA--[protein]-cysteine S-methyltransferase [Deltaproteobacteria bacterium]